MKSRTYPTNVTLEIQLEGYSDDSVQIVHEQTGTKKSIIPFRKGNGTQWFRFATSVPGQYRFTYNAQAGSFTVHPYRGRNLLLKHGPLTIVKKERYLRHIDGTHFFWLADTWWYGATNRSNLDKEFKTLLSKRKKQNFTVVQMVIGIPPEINRDSEESENSGGKPFLEDGSINPFYFDFVDKKIEMLVKQGIVPCLVGGWGNHIDWFGPEKIICLWKEIISRYSSYPVVFCLTGEVDGFPIAARVGASNTTIVRQLKRLLTLYFPTRLVQYIRTITERVKQRGNTDVRKERLEKWKQVAEYISHSNPYGRLLSVHVSGQLSSYELFLRDHTLFSFHSIQSGHSEESVRFMVSSLVEKSRVGIPLLNMEPWYEGILGNFGAYHQRFAFWASMLCGGIGHSYGAHGIWQMAKERDNFMNHWGNSFWKKALDFEGAGQIGTAKRFLEQYEWWKLRPVFDRISPHWTTKHPQYPFVAEIGNTHTFIYFPKVDGSLTFGLDCVNMKSPLTAVFINPATMKRMYKQSINSKTFTFKFTEKYSTEDVLVIIS